MTDYEAYKATKQFSCLNGMRCISIVYVIWRHATWFPVANTSLLIDYAPFLNVPMFLRGYVGVDIFFVISGFLIVTLLLREREATGSISLKKFYVRRFLRIFPIYYTILLALTLYLFFVNPVSGWREPFFKDLPFYATYTSNWHENNTNLGITWSLSAEEQFYLCWPPIETFLAHSASWILLAFILVNQLLNLVGLTTIFGPSAAHFQDLPMVVCTFTPICLGVLMAHMLHHRRSFDLCFPFFGKKYSPLIMLVGLLMVLNWPGVESREGARAYVIGGHRLAIQFFAFLLVGSVVIREKNIFQELLTIPIVNRIGVVSYGMYLYQLFFAEIVSRLMEKWSIHFPLAMFFGILVLTYLFSELSYRYYETPFLKLKSRFSTSR